MTEFEQKTLALLESIDRSLAALMKRLQAIDETAEPWPGSDGTGWPGGTSDLGEPADHRNLRRGEPRRQGEAHRWPR